jgi:hypothetical protein
MVVATAMLIGLWLSAESRADTHAALDGAWTLNKELSDQPATRGDDRGTGGDRGRRNGGYGRGGGGGFGRGGGGFGRGGGGSGGAPANRDDMARMREAMRDITNPPDHLTITQTDVMIVVTGPDGRTTRLSPDGKKVKDDNTRVERKTKWDGDKLVSEISGLGSGKITQAFSADPEHHQLRITALIEGGGRANQPRTITHIYDADAR